MVVVADSEGVVVVVVVGEKTEVAAVGEYTEERGEVGTVAVSEEESGLVRECGRGGWECM